MKAVHFSDLHLDNYTVGSKVPGDRLEDGLKVIDDVYKHAISIGAKLITFGGDWNNTPKFISTLVENLAMERLSYWLNKAPDIQWYCISGNHDFATKNLIVKPAHTSLTPIAIAFSPRFRVIDNMGAKVVNDGVYGIPYYEYPEHYSEALDAAVVWAESFRHVAPMRKVTLLIHQTPNGIGNTNIKADTDVNDPRYKHFDLVLCGHIHISQRITPKFVLAGNPLHKDNSDEGLEKGFWEYDLSNPAETLKFISRKGKYPEFRKVRHDDKIAKDCKDIITIIPEEVSIVLDERAGAESFGVGVSTEDMLRNYWERTDVNKDEAVLKIGLSLLN